MNLFRDAATRRACLVAAGVLVVIVLLLCVAALLGIRTFPLDDDPDPTATAVAGSPGTLLVSVLDVGQAQAVAVIAPDGTSLLIDAGRSQQRVEDLVVPYLREHGVERLDYLVLSHPDQDHVGGMPQVLEMMSVETYVDSAIPSANQTYAETLEMVIGLDIEAVEARRGVTLDAGPDIEIEILWPVEPLLESGGEPDSNGNSAVVSIRYGDVEILDPGDLEEEGEVALVELDGEGLDADILVAGHHGSNTSSSAEFLDAVNPEAVVISAGFENQYGHPHAEVLQRLRSRNIDIYRTDLDGTVEIRTDGESFEIETLGTEATP